MARNGHAIPIPGFRTTAQVEENAAAMAFGPLSTARMTEIARLLDRTGGARSSPDPYA
jgi:aryl-alcohol dehydrogenase-like predicted oxidoreductase